jgi:hypothetical protein
MANSYDFEACQWKGAAMKQMSALVLGLALLAGHANAGPGGLTRQQEEFPPPTPLEDPYVPPAGDPDPFASDGPGEEPSPLNPQGD